MTERKLREERRWLLANDDTEKISPAVFAALREIEIKISWAEHESFRHSTSSRREVNP
jgi:hypothetical protein